MANNTDSGHIRRIMTGEPRPSELFGEAPVQTEASAYRESEFKCRFPVKKDAKCPKCGGFEVYSPMQTMDLPMIRRCLGCAYIGPDEEFE